MRSALWLGFALCLLSACSVERGGSGGDVAHDGGGDSNANLPNGDSGDTLPDASTADAAPEAAVFAGAIVRGTLSVQEGLCGASSTDDCKGAVAIGIQNPEDFSMIYGFSVVQVADLSAGKTLEYEITNLPSGVPGLVGGRLAENGTLMVYPNVGDLTQATFPVVELEEGKVTELNLVLDSRVAAE